MFGSYVVAQDNTKVTKHKNPRTYECISLVPDRNLQGTQKLICLETGGVLNIINTTIMLAPYQVIKKLTTG